MDDKDRSILNTIQRDFPLEAEPFRAVGERVGLPAQEVLERVRRLKEDGVIRRIGAVFEPRKIGFTSTLCAARVPEKKAAVFTAAVNACPGVTHHYRRDHEYNYWFTFIAPSAEALETALAEIREKTGVEVASFRSVRTYKIDASFEV
jgi:DNA-binding Lrp family transcriptional regulator